MATISIETKMNPQVSGMQVIPASYCPSELSVHTVGANVHSSDFSPHDGNRPLNLSESPLQIKVGMKIDVETSKDLSCDFCGRKDEGNVCQKCSNVNHLKYLPQNSENSGSVPRCNCQNFNETGATTLCHCVSRDSKPVDKVYCQNLRNVDSDQESQFEHSVHSSSLQLNSADDCPHSENFQNNSSQHEPDDQADSVHKYYPQEFLETDSVHTTHSQDSTNTTLGHQPHTRILTGAEHKPGDLSDTSLEDCPGLKQSSEEPNLTTDQVDRSATHSDRDLDPDILTIIPTENENTFSLRALSRKQKLIVFSFCIVGFANFLCLSLIAPFFPKEAREKDVSNLVSGWIFAAFPLTQFIFAPAFGKLIPIVGLKFMHLSGTFISGGCTILFGAMAYVDVTQGNEIFITMCFILRFVQALGCCANQTASYSLCAQEFRETVGTIFGMGEVFVGLGFMCGPAIGGVLYGLGGFLLPFAVIGGTIIIITILNFWIVPSDNFVPQESTKKISLVELFKSLNTVVNCLTIMVAAMIWSILDPTLEPHLEEFNLSSELIGLLFLLMASVYAIASPFWGRISDKMKDSRPILVIGCLLSSGGMLLLGPSTLLGFQQDDNILWLNIVSLIIIGIADSAAIIPTFDLLFKIAEERGFDNDINTFSIIAGVWGSMYALGDFLGPALGGFLLDEVGFQSMTSYISIVTVVMAAILIVNILIDWRCGCKSRKSEYKETEETAPLLSQKNETNRYMDNSDLLDTYPPQQMATDMV
ncbi:MFS-type transporter SLC18B1-like [Pecten maximus]|uniref:MFS-type transporter SLC18B1-like n=1 Tax=Pecten maximus TaxID=6579 RepID=UPI001458F1AF|nr:MFS-type transporter SLC18B1-like [Pecten maximus]